MILRPTPPLSLMGLVPCAQSLAPSTTSPVALPITYLTISCIAVSQTFLSSPPLLLVEQSTTTSSHETIQGEGNFGHNLVLVGVVGGLAGLVLGSVLVRLFSYVSA